MGKNESGRFPIEFDRLIAQRRSIRKYTSVMPPEEWITGMLNAAIQSPSPSNHQPVRILRIRSEEKRAALHQALTSGRTHLLRKHADTKASKRIRNWIRSYYRFSEFMFKAPLLFAFAVALPTDGFAKKMQTAGLLAEDQRRNSDTDITVGLALEAFILKATAYGLGTCILTAPLVFIQEIETVLEVEHLRLACLLTAGFANETPVSISRKTISEIYHEI